MPSDRTIAIAITNPIVAGARVEVQANAAPDLWLHGVTNADGYVAWAWNDGLGDSAVAVFAEGFVPYQTPVHWRTPADPAAGPPPLNHQLTIGVDLPPLTPAIAPTPAPGDPVCVPLYADGVTLRNAEGARVSLCGYDLFTALRMEIDDPSGGLLEPFIDESHARGFNLWRVFGEASMSENGYYTVDPREPGYYEALDRLAARLTSNGIYLLHTCYADNQVFKCGLEHWQQTAAVLRPYEESVFLSGGNQWQKNGFDPVGLPDPEMHWWSRGSGTEDAKPVTPNGSTFVEFHPRRDYPKGLDDTVASATYIEHTYKFVLPLIISEPARMGEDGSGDVYLNEEICGQFAQHYAAQCAGAVLHMRPGQKGFLIPPGSACDRIATAWGSAWYALTERGHS